MYYGAFLGRTEEHFLVPKTVALAMHNAINRGLIVRDGIVIYSNSFFARQTPFLSNAFLDDRMDLRPHGDSRFSWIQLV